MPHIREDLIEPSTPAGKLHLHTSAVQCNLLSPHGNPIYFRPVSRFHPIAPIRGLNRKSLLLKGQSQEVHDASVPVNSHFTH